MGVTVTPVPGIATTSKYRRAFDIIATADGDTTANVDITGMLFPAALTDPDRRVVITCEPRGAKFYTQLWIVTSINTTTLVMTKTSVAGGTGDAASQIRVHVEVRLSPYA